MRKTASSREIFDKGSQLTQLVRIAGDLQTDEVNLRGLDALIRARIYQDCNYYVQSSRDSIFCASGEINGCPFVREACNRCVVGQFSEKGLYVGEIIPAIGPAPQKLEDDVSSIF